MQNGGRQDLTLRLIRVHNVPATPQRMHGLKRPQRNAQPNSLGLSASYQGARAAGDDYMYVGTNTTKKTYTGR